MLATVFIALLVVTGVALWSLNTHAPTIDEQAACTMEAKLCPDGSYVGRSGPSCAFAECPGNLSADFGTATQKGITFQYPIATGTSYVSFVDWPPQIQLADSAYRCMAAGTSTALPAGMTEERTVEGTTFCVTTEGEGAAGSTYLSYAYSFAHEDGVAVLRFSLRKPQCVNYDKPTQTTCQSEQDAFNVDNLVAQMVASIK